MKKSHPYRTNAFFQGFTSWSASRDPTQVFTLLQTLYHAFDVLAARHGVYKIETIGDSYVGVAGIPVFQEKHAVIAVEFASACLDKMDELTIELERTLGEGTSGLSMRFGLHSGALTAGVLSK
jgi:class 3 adenylate cyclase